MSGWKILLTIASVGFSIATPAGAAPSGTVAGSTEVRAEEIRAKCTYFGVTTLSGGIQFAYGGAIAAASTSTNQPFVSSVTCRLEAHYDAPTPPNSSSSTTACPGAACATANTSPVWSLPKSTLLCVSGLVIFGPDLTFRALAPECSTSALT